MFFEFPIFYIVHREERRSSRSYRGRSFKNNFYLPFVERRVFLICTFMIIIKYCHITAPSIFLLVNVASGKSFGAKKYVIDQYAKKHSQFLYLRRYDNELKEIFQNTKNSSKDFFDDIISYYPKIELCAKNRKFYYNGECFRLR